MQIIRPKHISVRNPQAPGPRSRLGSALCSRRRRYDARRSPIFAGHLRSGVLCINAGKLEVGSHSWRSLFAPACPGNGFSLHEPGYWYRFFNFDLPEGSRGNTEADWRQWRQTRFGHARSERRRPQFTAHNSVRPLKNGLSLGGSSATRPIHMGSTEAQGAAPEKERRERRRVGRRRRERGDETTRRPRV